MPVNLSYFRCIAGVDENVGKVLDALDRLKLAEDTVVVYASDNGFYLGEHTLADKRSGVRREPAHPADRPLPEVRAQGRRPATTWC